ncbi:MAG TPA: LysR substrate-binding domain-containing protein, partial [Stellaceae bacterium]|nr:LysR substrate-binding domain-containing protein [Stellaceae bacterium]
HFGSLETTAALRLAPVLAAYVAAYPEVDLALTTGTSAELVAQVLEHRLEGAFVCGPAHHPELLAEPVFAEELVLVTAPSCRRLDDALARRDLKIVVLRAGCSYRQRLEEMLARRGVVGLRRLEFGTIEGLLGCAAAGLGVTLLPRALVEPARRARRVAVHTLPPEEARVETLFIRRRDAYVSSALAAFLACVRPGAAAAAAE